MKLPRNIIQILSTLAICLALTLTTVAQDEKLVGRINAGEPGAMLEAGRSGDQRLIPMLKNVARPHSVPQVNSDDVKGMNAQQVQSLKEAMWRPVYAEPSAENARMALAKLGVKEYLDEIVLEATSPTNSPVYRERLEYRGSSTGAHDALMTQYYALKKLVYINNPSTIKYIASVLYDTYDPNKGNTGDVIWPVPAVEAAETLHRILGTSPSDISDTAAWKKWWEQNKDKYP